MKKIAFVGLVVMMAMGAAAQVPACPELSCEKHDADTTEDWRIDISELLRVIQLFNVRAYHCDTTGTSEDGFAPGPGCVNDTTPPVITLVGNAHVTVECGGTYTELSAIAEDTVDGNVAIVIGGDVVDETILGDYHITYDASDAAGNHAVSVHRTVTVQDTTAPVITLEGSALVEVQQGSVYTDDGATASDDCEGDLTAEIVVGGDVVDTNTTGNYVITYDVEDGSGNAADQETRTVMVVDGGEGEGEGEGEDTIPPVITLIGPSTIEVEQGSEFTDPGATAVDDVDGDLTTEIVVGGDIVDTNTVGTYIITYDVEDSSGNVAVQKTRTVEVVATSMPHTAYYVPVGSPVTLEVPAVSDAAYQWQYSGNIARPDMTWANVTSSGGGIAGMTTNRLRFLAAQTSDGRWYRCLVNGVPSPIIYLFPEQPDMVRLDFERATPTSPLTMTVTPGEFDRFQGPTTATKIGVEFYLGREPYIIRYAVDISNGLATITIDDFDVDFDGTKVPYEIYGETSTGERLVPDLNFFELYGIEGNHIPRGPSTEDGNPEGFHFLLTWQ